MERLPTTLASAPRERVAERPLPIASAIYWTPAGVTASAEADGAAVPIFVRQAALAAIHDHVGAGSGAASLGLLVGGAYRSPDTKAEYIVVEATIRLPWRVAGDDTKPVLQRALAAVRKEPHQGDRQLVGWYHSHVFPHPGLSPNDADTHQTLFEPWQVALVVVSRDGLLGGLFRSSAGAAWTSDPLPFYEVPHDAALLPDGRKVTDLAWDNYHTAEHTIPSDRVRVLRQAAPDAPRLSPLLFPDEPDDTSPGWGATRPLRSGRAARMAAYGVVGVVATVGLVTAYELAASRSAPALANPPSATAASPVDRLDRTADTLALALTAFDARARLFEQRQMGCPELAGGLVQVEEWWIAYNAARKSAFVLDSTRDARDRSAYAAVDAAERRFERARCARP